MNFTRYLLPVLILFWSWLPTLCWSNETVHFPITLDHALIRSALSRQLYTGAGESAVPLDKKDRCTLIELHRPEISSAESYLKVESPVRIKFGLPGSKDCLGVIDWSGHIEVLQKLLIDETGWNIAFKTMNWRVYDKERKPIKVPDPVANLIERYVIPFMNRAHLDLGLAKNALTETLPLFFSRDARDTVRQVLGTARLNLLVMEKDALKIDVIMNVDQLPMATRDLSSPSPEKIKRLTTNWEGWDDFMVYEILTLPGQALKGKERNDLLEALLDNRYSFVTSSANGQLNGNIVREQFVRSWEKSAQTVRKRLAEASSISPFNQVSFFTLGNAIVALDMISPEVDLRMNRNALSQLAALLDPASSPPPLAYSTAVNDRLRLLLGFGRALDETGPAPKINELKISQCSGIPGARCRRESVPFFVRPVYADEKESAPREEIVQWKPPSSETFVTYLEKFYKALNQSGKERLSMNTLEEKYHPLFNNLLCATAWQESCWRQFKQSKGTLSLLVSYNQSSVGAMQINERVWRGMYAVESLRWNTLYNINAGTEVLELYLRRYALRRMSKEHPLDEDTLARTVYAMYNGGPGEYYKFLKRKETNSFYGSDNLFWEKYLWSKDGNYYKLSRCLLGTETEPPVGMTLGASLFNDSNDASTANTPSTE